MQSRRHKQQTSKQVRDAGPSERGRNAERRRRDRPGPGALARTVALPLGIERHRPDSGRVAGSGRPRTPRPALAVRLAGLTPHPGPYASQEVFRGPSGAGWNGGTGAVPGRFQPKRLKRKDNRTGGTLERWNRAFPYTRARACEEVQFHRSTVPGGDCSRKFNDMARNRTGTGSELPVPGCWLNRKWVENAD